MDSIATLVYTSKAIAHFDQEELDLLVENATKVNLELEITGFLFFKKNHFLQYLEGSTAKVTALMEKISNDPRHDVLHIEYGSSLFRKYPNWAMRYIKEEISMELVLMDYMISLSASLNKEKQEKSNNVWRMMEKIFIHINRLKAYNTYS